MPETQRDDAINTSTLKIKHNIKYVNIHDSNRHIRMRTYLDVLAIIA